MSDGDSNSTGWALLPLRLFLGFTFVYAGIQKLADPSFFDPSNPGSIQAQLQSAAPASPLGPLLRLAGHVPVPVGVVIALAELAIGIGTVLGFRTRIAAIGGMAISLLFFLTISWQDRPYYLGADIVFLFAWTPFALAGAGNAWALDTTLDERGASAGPDLAVPGHAPVGRRAFLTRSGATAVLAVAGLAAAGFAAAFGRLTGNHSADSLHSSGTPPTTTQNPVIHNAGAIPVGNAVPFTDPVTGDPAFLVRTESAAYVAFDAVCPHAGCHVAYSSSVAEFVCPCHGSRFNGRTGAVVSGPATRGLTEISVSVAPDGSVSAS